MSKVETLESTTKQKLSSIEKQLLECAKNRQPVLLYGEDSTHSNPVNLVLRIHKMNGGKKSFLVSSKSHLKNIENLTGKPDYIKRAEMLKYFKNTEKSWLYLNCDSWSGENVFSKLARWSCLYNNEIVSPIFGILLLYHKGTLFLDNLHCSPVDDEDDINYSELAKIIKQRKKEGEGTELFKVLEKVAPISVNWLVAYTYNPDDFPEPFRNQFKEISLDGKVKKTKKISGITKQRGRKPKNEKYDEFKSILEDILGSDKNSSLDDYVTKVKKEMRRKKLMKVDKATGLSSKDLIYKDNTIRTYTQDHPEYKKIQKRKEKRKKV